jgi:hypothetical protein
MDYGMGNAAELNQIISTLVIRRNDTGKLKYLIIIRTAGARHKSKFFIIMMVILAARLCFMLCMAT